MTVTGLLDRSFRILSRFYLLILLVIAVGFGLVLLSGALPFLDPHLEHWLLGYLAGYVFCLGLTLGALALLLIHPLTGGDWGYALRPGLLAAIRTLPLLIVLFVPLWLSLPDLYRWAGPDALTEPVLQHKQWYLNVPFFSIRAIGYFVIWLGLTLSVSGLLRNNRRTLPSALSCIGLILYAITVTLASFDWLVSLQPEWSSSIFGMTLGVNQLLAATALGIAAGGYRIWPRQPQLPSAALCRDMANILLMFILLWAYLAYMEYLTIWAGDLPNDIVWYLPRTQTSWRWLAWALITFHLVVPFALLLFRALKSRPLILRRIAIMVLVANFLNAIWLVIPGLRPDGLTIRWTDPLAVLVVVLPWLLLFGFLLNTVQPSKTVHYRHG